MSEHTPGPWMIATSNSYRRIVNHRHEPVAVPVTQSDGHPDIEFPNGGADGPDARLIAAAPELLEALKLLRSRSVSLCLGTPVTDLDEVFAAADSAIAKAETPND